MSLVPIDTSSEVAVTDYLTRARDWLSRAVDETGPEQIAAAKAEIATAAEATKQLGLSREIQLDAQEMVRRAEYALGKAIRKGQEMGTVSTRADGAAFRDGTLSPGVDKVSPRTFYGGPSKTEGSKAYQDGLAMAATDIAQFDEALAEAKAEGNLSRANVVRKVKQQASPATRSDRADLIADLAAQGYSSRQMPAKVGVSEETVRQIARDFDIEIPADRSVRKTRRIDSTAVATKTVTALEGLVMGIDLIDYDEIDPREASQWATSLTDSLRVLNRFAKQIKEMAQ